MNYQLAYRIGFHPWEDAEGHAPFVEKFSELLGEEEHGRDAPFGTALDLGTGSGIWAIELAKRGWQVTAVDLVDKAVAASRRASQRRGRGGRASSGRRDGATQRWRWLRLSVAPGHRNLSWTEGSPAPRDGPGSGRSRRTGCNAAPARVAEASKTADPWRGCERDRGRVPRLDCDRRWSIALQGAEADRSAPETRRTLVSASTRDLALRRRRCHARVCGNVP